MGFLDLFRTKWKNSNASIRIEEIQKLTDESILAQLALSDEDEMVRYHATERITNQKILTQIFKKETVYKVRLTAIKKIINLSALSDLSKTDWDFSMRKEISQLLLDRSQLKNVVDEVEETGNLSIETEIILLRDLKSNDKSLETKESFLPYLFKSSDPEVFDAIFSWLLNTYHPLSKSTIASLKIFCPDYVDILIDLRTYETKSEYWDGGYSNDGGGSPWNNEKHSYDEKLMNQATEKLCKIRTPVTSNLLHIITKRKSVSITLSVVCFSGCDGDLDWHTQKELAIDELKERGNPTYDTKLYLKPKAWQIK